MCYTAVFAAMLVYIGIGDGSSQLDGAAAPTGGLHEAALSEASV